MIKLRNNVKASFPSNCFQFFFHLVQDDLIKLRASIDTNTGI